MPEARFGVVVINWNGSDDTVACLESLFAADPPPSHVVVVDNGSTDDSVRHMLEWVRTHVPGWTEASARADSRGGLQWLTLSVADRNLGFSGGNNAGLRLLATRTAVSHFVLLNNDAMVAPDCFAHLANAISDFPETGLFGALIYRHPDRNQIWFSGAVEIPWRALVVHRIDAPVSNSPYPTPFITGCAMVISRALYAAQGGLAEVYNPIYWEDTDYSRRARAAGWPLLIVPQAHVYHRVGASGDGERLMPRTARAQNRNRAIYVRRNYHGMERAIALGYLCVTKPLRGLLEIARGRVELGRAILHGLWLGITEPVA